MNNEVVAYVFCLYSYRLWQGGEEEDIKPWQISWSHLFFAAYLRDFQSCVFSMLSLCFLLVVQVLFLLELSLYSRGTHAGLPPHFHRSPSYLTAFLHESKKEWYRLYPELVSVWRQHPSVLFRNIHRHSIEAL